MQGRSTSTSGSTLFGRFLMRVTSSQRKFTRRRIPPICLPGCSRSEVYRLQGVTPYPFWMNYRWLDPLGRGYVGNNMVQSDRVDIVLCWVRLRFKKSSPRWKFVGREYKILLVEFFNSSEKIVRSLMKHGRNNSADTLIRVCRWTGLSTSGKEELSTAVFREHNWSQCFLRVRFVGGCRQAKRAVDSVLPLSVSVYVSEFIYDPNSEFWVSFSSWTPCLHKEGYCPLLLYFVLDWFNNLSLLFYLEDVSNCRTSLNSCVRAFFLLFACSCDWWLFFGIAVLCCWNSNRTIFRWRVVIN